MPTQIVKKALIIVADGTEEMEAMHDVVIIPGGLSGVKNIGDCEMAKKIIYNQFKSGRFIAAICAGNRYKSFSFWSYPFKRNGNS
ncbi:hypothetical protein HZS_2519 [Henneguya salminicola]|nr:hypothetical protein HZS_2519 [Henneguya salminicola]